MARKKKSADWFTLGVDAWALAVEANMVIGMRMGALALGGPKAALEAERMVSEKIASNMKLGVALATGKYGTDPERVLRGSIRHYARTVAANRRRLAK